MKALHGYQDQQRGWSGRKSDSGRSTNVGINMTLQPKDFNGNNNESLRMLARAIAFSQGQFSLILARCNYQSLRQRLTQQLTERYQIKFHSRALASSATNLYSNVQAELTSILPDALIVHNLELVRDIDRLLVSTNNARDEFRKTFPFPLVLWVTDQVQHKLRRVAPDFTSWAATPIGFEMATDELIDFIEQTVNQVYGKVLHSGAGRFLDNDDLNLGIGSTRRTELKSAQNELNHRKVTLDPPLEASLEFVLGRAADGSSQESLEHYQRSLALWQQIEPEVRETEGKPQTFTSSSERVGCLLYYLGLWWRTYAERHRAEHQVACGHGAEYYQQCIKVFEQAERPDLVAKFINAWAEVLQRLGQWDDLEAVANTALTIHQTYGNPFRLARAYGFLAEVALWKSDWNKAQQLAQQALLILEQALSELCTPTSCSLDTDCDWERSFHQGWYLLSLARSHRGAARSQQQQQQAKIQDSLTTLETAKARTKPQYDPELYILILEELRQCYCQQGNYLTAFRVKQERRSIEQQYNFRAFIGAGRLQPKQQVTNPALPDLDYHNSVTPAIAASGRQGDVNRLMQRMGRSDHKLTVIYGPSGVGKSSLVQAGLIPTLKQKTIGSREVLTVFQQIYTDWIPEFGKALAKSLAEKKLIKYHGNTLETTAAILKTFWQITEDNILVVLVFDQFEEFFFAAKDRKQRMVFYEFMKSCLNIPYVKIILSLREDDLHYLLECNRLINLDVINNNILNKTILYYLGNFSPKQTKSVIKSLTENTAFSLEPNLTDALVKDLAGDTNEVLPIELQVVGAQLQAEKITTLADYLAKGPKEKLVERYLETAIKDCGEENERITKLVLYLLTDENGMRPLKTQAELAEDLDLDEEQLDLVMEVLVGSGLVFEVPEYPADRYQLVHDYLVSFIRQGQEPQILAELKLTKEELKQALHQEQEERRRAEIAEIKALSSLSQALLSSDDQLGALVASVKAGKRLITTEVTRDIKQQQVNQLQEIINNLQECNRLEGHDAGVFGVCLSPDGKLITSASEDGTIRIWGINGKALASCRGHKEQVFSINFSPNGEMFASASADGTIKLWQRDGKLLKTLRGHKNQVFNISFSPDGHTIAAASKDGTIQLWHPNGTRIKTLTRFGPANFGISFSPDGKSLAIASEDGTIKLWNLDSSWPKIFNRHARGVLSVCFSPDGRMLASGSWDGTAKLWNIDGKELNSIDNYGLPVYRVRFSPDGQLLALASKDNRIRLYNLDGIKLKTLRGHKGSVCGVSFSPDGRLLASASVDKTIRLWSLKGIGLNTQQSHTGKLIGFCFNSTGQQYASASEDKTVKLWSLDGTLLRTFSGHEASVRSVSFSPKAKLLATASVDGIIKIWHLNGALLQTFPAHGLSIRSLSFSPDGKILASAGNDRIIKLWGIDDKYGQDNGVIINTLNGHLAKILTIRFSQDGQMLASAGEDKTIKRWHLDGSLIDTMPAHSLKIVCLRFSGDGEIMASASADKTVKLWSLNGKLITTLQGHQAGVRGVVFSPDSQMIASVSADRTVKLWTRDGKEFKTLKGHLAPVCNACFLADGQTLVSVSEDGTAKIWNIDGTEIKTVGGPINGNTVVDVKPGQGIVTRGSHTAMSDLSSDLSSDLKDLLVKGCYWISDYLNHNPTLSESDRKLCDGILPEILNRE
ncbi:MULTISPECIES: tetratricopeptide repeat protein [unclassified Moorena]|uniref:WD40 domain-containing protein n=1 Tax=unclassified Moorena TaxID=2683338 RepID=UPI0013FF86C3|nr:MULTISPECIES: tetratricopeptide repeat protein [unclassified Moorena]NEO14911.1 tetratricopeptide repeat protein [Moorena sp. SIO3E8]NEQ02396.1 tetratricopeptide repeat protein [Moorena sp. SIO3F7]